MAPQGGTCLVLGFRVADLGLWLDARGSGVPLAVPACYAPFLVPGSPGAGLTLRVRDGPLRSTEGWRSLFYDAESWQLWRDGAGSTVFVAARRSPPRRQVAVDPGFGTGEVVGEFRTGLPWRQAVYPLQDIDMALYANWLAESGDLIVHAAGIDDHGDGYAFVGPAGAGKSTLAASLSSSPAVTVLGEDQVILRYVEGRFCIYGTPWHLDPAMCSPRGVPLAKLFFLDRRAEHGVEPCGPVDGVAQLLQTAFVPYYRPSAVATIMERLAQLAEQVPFYRLSYRLGTDAMELISDE